MFDHMPQDDHEPEFEPLCPPDLTEVVTDVLKGVGFDPDVTAMRDGTVRVWFRSPAALAAQTVLVVAALGGSFALGLDPRGAIAVAWPDDCAPMAAAAE